MNCYKHSDNPAIGICKACNKAVCQICEIDVGNGIACSEICKSEVIEVNQIIEKSKIIYSIGKNAEKNLIPSGVAVYIFFSVTFLGWSAYEYFTTSRVIPFLTFIGVAFALMGVFTYKRAKKLNINC